MRSNHLTLGMLIVATAACTQADVEPGSAAQEGRPDLEDVLALFADVQDVRDFTRPSATAWEEVETWHRTLAFFPDAGGQLVASTEEARDLPANIRLFERTNDGRVETASKQELMLTPEAALARGDQRVGGTTFTPVETDGGRFRDSTEIHYNPAFPGLGVYDFTCRRDEPFLVCRIIRIDDSVSFYVLERRTPNEELSLQCERLAAPAPGGPAGLPAPGTPDADDVQTLFADLQDVRDFTRPDITPWGEVATWHRVEAFFPDATGQLVATTQEAIDLPLTLHLFERRAGGQLETALREEVVHAGDRADKLVGGATFTPVVTSAGRFQDSNELQFMPVFPGLGAFHYTCRNAEPFLVCRVIRTDDTITFHTLERRTTDQVLTNQCDALNGAAPAPPPWAGMHEAGTVTRNAVRRFVTPSLPAGSHTFTMTGTRDADLYVRAGSEPTTTAFDCRPFLSGSNETCSITLAAPAVIHVMVRGFASGTSRFDLVGRSDEQQVSLPADLQGTIVRFLRRHRMPVDDHRLSLVVEAPTALRPRLRGLVLTAPDGEVILDSAAGVGHWSDDAGRLADRYFTVDVAEGQTGDGLYTLRIELNDGTVHGGRFPVERAWSTTDVEIVRPLNTRLDAPANTNAPVSRRPDIEFRDFQSAEFRAPETRDLEVWVTDNFVEQFRVRPAVGTTLFRPEANLSVGEQRVLVTFGESRTVGPLVLRRESTTIHRFFTQ